MSEILTDAALADALANLCDVDGLGKARGAITIYASHFALSSRLSALEAGLLRIRDTACDAAQVARETLDAAGETGEARRG